VTFLTSRKTSVEEVNQIFIEESETERYARRAGSVTRPARVSDIIGDPRASVVDLQLTRVADGDLVKTMS
jgi:glyceraldehyde 3-phosphate dehydrogenase